MIQGLTCTIIMFGVIIIIFICSGITLYLEDRKMSKKEKIEKFYEKRIQEFIDIRNKVDRIIEINNL